METVIRLASIFGIALWLAACATSPVRTERAPEANLGSVRRVAVAPFEAQPIPQAQASDGAVEEDAASVVTSRVLEALGESDRFEVVPPEEVERWLAAHGPTGAGIRSPEGVREIARGFGVDAVLVGRVHRYTSRVGGERGSSRPASVGFDLELRSADGARLWTGSYDEAQRSLNENLFAIGRARERGFRWVTAEELARYGARELVSRLEEDAGPWR